MGILWNLSGKDFYVCVCVCVPIKLLPLMWFYNVVFEPGETKQTRWSFENAATKTRSRHSGDRFVPTVAAQTEWLNVCLVSKSVCLLTSWNRVKDIVAASGRKASRNHGDVNYVLTDAWLKCTESKPAGVVLKCIFVINPLSWVFSTQ